MKDISQDKIAELQRLYRQEELDDLKEVVSTRAGRRFLWRIFEMTKVFSSTFNVDVQTAAFNEGQRNVGLVVLNDMMTVSPEKFITMQRGAKEREALHGKRIAELTADRNDD